MKRLILVLVSSLIISMTVTAQVNLDGATEAYTNGDYQTAIEIYELAIAAGQASGELYFNLGNAYFEADLQSYALVNYLRADYYAPRDTAINQRIARIRSEHNLSSNNNANAFLQLATVTNNFFSLRELSIIGLALWFAFGIAVAIGNFRGVWRINAIASVGTISTIFALVAVILFSRMWVQYQMPSAVVVEDGVPVYSGSDDTYLTLYSISNAREVRVINRNDNFVQILLEDGRRGWVNEVVLIYPLQGL